MRLSRLKSLLLYAGIGQEEYSVISPMIWKGNIYIQLECRNIYRQVHKQQQWRKDS